MLMTIFKLILMEVRLQKFFHQKNGNNKNRNKVQIEMSLVVVEVEKSIKTVVIIRLTIKRNNKMCLNYQKNYKTIPKFGYKVFAVDSDQRLIPEITRSRDLNGKKIIYEEGIVYKATRTNLGKKYLKDGNDRKYLTGFHCFVSLGSARHWVSSYKGLAIYKVKIDNIVAQGVQCDEDIRSRTIIAQSMELIKRIE
ncbi:MAG: hypothetical protein NUV97_00590 [archaeon]|nr:hypothetical protein [archaeon]